MVLLIALAGSSPPRSSTSPTAGSASSPWLPLAFGVRGLLALRTPRPCRRAQVADHEGGDLVGRPDAGGRRAQRRRLPPHPRQLLEGRCRAGSGDLGGTRRAAVRRGASSPGATARDEGLAAHRCTGGAARPPRGVSGRRRPGRHLALARLRSPPGPPDRRQPRPGPRSPCRRGPGPMPGPGPTPELGRLELRRRAGRRRRWRGRGPRHEVGREAAASRCWLGTRAARRRPGNRGAQRCAVASRVREHVIEGGHVGTRPLGHGHRLGDGRAPIFCLRP